MDAERGFRWAALSLGVAALASGVLSILLAAAPVLSGQLIVAAVALALAVFVLVAGSGFSAAYREIRHPREPPRA